jgi:importin subunit beta-1
MKEAILATLNSPSNLVRMQVANVIAAICSIEIPRKEWTEIVPMLSENSKHTDYNVKLASLMTLGYVCEEIHPDDIDNLTKSSIIDALTSNIQGISESDQEFEACKLSIKAMIFSIPFATQNFQVENERNCIMNSILNVC